MTGNIMKICHKKSSLMGGRLVIILFTIIQGRLMKNISKIVYIVISYDQQKVSQTNLKRLRLIILFTMLQRTKLDTRSMYRSVRYRVNRDQHTRTADPTTCNFRIKRNSVYEATMAQTIDTAYASKMDNTDTEEVRQFMKTDYLKSFNSMMQTTSRIKSRQISFKQDKKQTSFFDDARIILPAFEQNQKQVQQSEHALLTPFLKPFNHVQQIYRNCDNELKSQKLTCAEIKHGLKHIKDSKMKELSEIQRLANEGFEGIRAILRKNQINQQQRKLKTKRELQQLESQHQSNRQLFNSVDERSSNLQITIFNSTPYNLRQARDQKGELYI